MGEIAVTTLVTVAPEDAFAAFTGEIDRWWARRSAGLRGLNAVDATIVRFEGDRLVAVSEAGVEVLATVTGWEPPNRIELDWHGPHAQPGDSVVVDFAPEGGGTRVTVHHRRSGLRPEEAVAAVLGLWWGDGLRRLSRGQRADGADPPR